MPRLCAFGCKTSEATTHSFPNLKRFPEQFVTWVNLVGGILEKPSDYDYYTKKIVCDKHFKDSDKNRNNRLNKLAVPTLFLPEQKNNLPQDFNGEPLQAALPSSNIGSDETVLHSFPHPKKDNERFLLWTQAIGPIVTSLEPQFVYSRRRICHYHFDTKYLTWTRRLSPAAIPTLLLPGNSSTEQPKELSDHSYHSIKEKPEGNTSTTIESASLPPIDLQQKYDKQQLDFNLTECGELIEGDAFDNAESPSSLVPPSEIGETIEHNDAEEENIYSWQKTDLIETDDPEVPPPTPVPEIPQTSEDTLSLFCDTEPEGELPSEPVVVPEDVEYRCNDCAVIIDGFSWWCVQCACGALCCACAQRAPHDAHYVLRAPLTATHTQTEAVLAVVRQQLEKENLIKLNGTDVSVKEEVKDEPSCPSSPAAPAASPDPLAVEPHPYPLHVEPHPDSLTEEPHLLTTGEFIEEDTVDHHPFKRPRLIKNITCVNTNSTVTEDVQQRKAVNIYAFKIPKGSRTTVEVRPSTGTQSGNDIPRDITGLQSCSNTNVPNDTGSQSGINDIAHDNTESQHSYHSKVIALQKDQPNKLARPSGLKTLQIKSSEITRPDINSRRAQNILKGLLKIQQIDRKEPKLFQVPLEILESESLNVTSEVQLEDRATNLDEVNDVVVEYLDEEYLEYNSEENRLDKDVQHEIEDPIKITESGAEDLSKDTIDRYQEDVNDSSSYTSYTKNETDIDKEYKVKEDIIEDGWRNRNTTNTLRAPSEAIVCKAAEAVVHLEPLTTLDIRKATFRRKVGRPRKRRKD